MSELWELEKRQIEALQGAKVEALAICEWVGRLCEAVRDDRPEWSCYAIGQLLDHRNGYRLPQCLKVVSFFIDQVRIPVEVPWSPMTRTLSFRLMKKCSSAHGGATTLWNALHGFLSRKLIQLCPEVGVVFDFSQTADMLVDQHWETLRRDLANVAQFDCNALEDAISREAQAAMEVCNAKLISAMADSTEPAASPRLGEGRSGETQRAAKPEQGEGDGGAGSTTPPAGKKEADLQPADRKAYYAYSWAESRLLELEADATRVTDREAYDWLQENGLPDEKDSLQLATEFAGYRLPAFDTWSKQVRNARKVLGDQKHQKRAGRAAGRSIARGRDIERQPGADD